MTTKQTYVQPAAKQVKVAKAMQAAEEGIEDFAEVIRGEYKSKEKAREDKSLLFAFALQRGAAKWLDQCKLADGVFQGFKGTRRGEAKASERIGKEANACATAFGRLLNRAYGTTKKATQDKRFDVDAVGGRIVKAHTPSQLRRIMEYIKAHL